jgi:hypothetical protein
MATRRFPELRNELVEAWSLRDQDALAFCCLLDACAAPVVVLEIGTFIGASAFHFAGHSKVTRVISVDPNPSVADEVSASRHRLGIFTEPEPLSDLRVLDVARTLLKDSGPEAQKIELVEGELARAEAAAGSPETCTVIPTLQQLKGEPLIAFIDGCHTGQAVQADLKAVFQQNPTVVAILDDCRFAWGPYVQAGVAAFLDGEERRYRFQLLADLNPSLSTCQLGIVYDDAQSVDVTDWLARFAARFSSRLDPVALLIREEHLSTRARGLLDELQEVRGRLETARLTLETVYRSRSWRITKPLRVVTGLLRRLTNAAE